MASKWLDLLEREFGSDAEQARAFLKQEKCTYAWYVKQTKGWNEIVHRWFLHYLKRSPRKKEPKSGKSRA